MLGAAGALQLHRRQLPTDIKTHAFLTGRGDDVLELLEVRRRSRDLHGLRRRASSTADA